MLRIELISSGETANAGNRGAISSAPNSVLSRTHGKSFIECKESYCCYSGEVLDLFISLYLVSNVLSIPEW